MIYDSIKNAQNIHVIGISGTECASIALFLQQQRLPFTAHDLSEEKRFERSFNANHFGYSPTLREKMLKQIEQFKTINFQDKYLQDIEKADLIFVSQNWEAYSPNAKLKPIFQQNPSKFATITQLYFQLFPGKIIAITGTNGKSTTAKLISEIMIENKIQVDKRVDKKWTVDNEQETEKIHYLSEKINSSRQKLNAEVDNRVACPEEQSDIGNKNILLSRQNLSCRVDKNLSSGQVDMSSRQSNMSSGQNNLSSKQGVDIKHSRLDVRDDHKKAFASSQSTDCRIDTSGQLVDKFKLSSRQNSSCRVDKNLSSGQVDMSSRQRVDKLNQELRTKNYEPNIYFTGNDRRNTQILHCLDKWTKNDWLVIEVSNRQLKFPLGRAPEIGVILNITKNHLTEYEGSFEAYKKGKFSLISQQTKDNIAVLNMDNLSTRQLINKTTGTPLPYSAREKLSTGVYLDGEWIKTGSRLQALGSSEDMGQEVDKSTLGVNNRVDKNLEEKREEKTEKIHYLSEKINSSRQKLNAEVDNRVACQEEQNDIGNKNILSSRQNLICRVDKNLSSGQGVDKLKLSSGQVDMSSRQPSRQNNVSSRQVDTDKIYRVDKICLLGEHNLSNILAAIATTRAAGVSVSVIRKVIENFRGIPQRLELVHQKNNIKFINDSASTTPESTIAAIQSFQQGSVHLICGGDTKGMDYDKLITIIRQNKTKIVALQSPLAEILQKSLTNEELQIVKTLQEAVKISTKNAKAGECVLLSPSAAWFCYFNKKIPLGGRGFEKFSRL
jgi:UDP-N-acetylmuramoylalanine-D-glutamate ligase